MNLVMFIDAIQHVARTSRVLRQPLGNNFNVVLCCAVLILLSGNVLLLGVGGSGRQSLTRLSAIISEYECAMVEIAGYGIPECYIFSHDCRCVVLCCAFVVMCRALLCFVMFVLFCVNLSKRYSRQASVLFVRRHSDNR